ncbi:aminoglycoside 6'-N-acetyltransferase [Alkalihalobacillus pseudalcaliphilus]|uniref:aminoglycoside 6'-N-acetyltransferase n=1 Tax=Alkalihalobacillus pseudalcaliphilus TaxID=79884 RepID=UPI000AD951A3
MDVKEVRVEESRSVAELMVLLWPNHSVEGFTNDIEELIEKDDASIYVAFEGNELIGFSQVQLRNDYVEGTGSSPVGYLEGLFVKEAYRLQGYAKELVKAAEHWAKQKGCSEFASDCELTNEKSLHTHLKLGFEEANRIICFKKKL